MCARKQLLSVPSRGDVLCVVSSQEAVRCRSSYHHYESKTRLNLKRCWHTAILTYRNQSTWTLAWKRPIGNMRGIRTVHSNGTDTTPPQTDNTAHCTPRHNALRPPQNHKSQQNQIRQHPLLGLHWDSHLYPFHGRLNQNKNYSMKKGNRKVKRTEKKRKYKPFFTRQVINWLLIGLFSPQTDRMETRNISRTRKCFPEDGEENHLFFYLCYLHKNFPYTHTQ